MANPNNLIRAPILNNPPPNLNNPAQPAQAQFVITPENEIGIASIVRRILIEERREIEPRPVDQGIDRNIDLTDLDKIPDVVRSLREFSGNRTEFSSWKKSTERILKIYEPLKGTAKYFGILNVIRNKIIGDADIALESYNTPLNWECIIKCLTTHYADQRDLGTLEYQLTSMVQGTNSVQEFYKKIYSHLSLILNKISCLEESQEAIQLLTRNYRNKALDTFVRGLRGDLPRLLGIREPKDLNEALHLCMKLDNQQFRAQYANSATRIQSHIPSQKHNNNRQHQNFYPQLAHIPQPAMNFHRIAYPNQSGFNSYHDQRNKYQIPYRQNSYTWNTNQQQPPNRPYAPKPPIPMEVDTSMQSKRVNYMNRPTMDDRFAGLRPLPQSMQSNQPRKHQRINHIGVDQCDPKPNQNEQEIETDIDANTSEPQHENEEIEDVTEYLKQFDIPDEYECTEYSDIHFLD